MPEVLKTGKNKSKVEKLQQAGGYRYLKARRPELYREIIGGEHKSEQKVVWLNPK